MKKPKSTITKDVFKDNRAPKRLVRKTDAVVERVLSYVANGMWITKVLKKPKMPSVRQWYEWLKKDPKLAKAFEEAVQCQIDHLVEAVIDEEPNPTDFELEHSNFYSKQRDRKLKGVLWLAERRSRQKYGNQVNVEVKHEIDVTPTFNRLNAFFAKTKHLESPEDSSATALECSKVIEHDKDIIKYQN